MREKDFLLTDFNVFNACEGQYSSQFIRNFGAVKVSENQSSVTVAISVGKKERSTEYLENYHAPKELIVISVTDRDFSEFIGRHLDVYVSDVTTENKEFEGFALEQFTSAAPAVAIVNAIFLEAIRKKASDIHIEPTVSSLLVRFRLDGVLHTMRELDKGIASALSSRIKIMANLNIMETRLPQDGRLQVSLEGISLDFRLSVIPVSLGESIVLRLFNADNTIPSLYTLGLNENHVEKLKANSHLPNGLMLVTGPTGSGKTTTLHSMLAEMDSTGLKIITIEDPVERILDGINQIQINDEISLSFDNMLRRVLRQDPNVIMVGEIRDSSTAELSMRSSLTGHLILSTLHTNDSLSAITRLENMGLQRYLIASVLRTVLAQRLVRRLCQGCACEGEEVAAYTMLKKKYGIKKGVYLKAKGCDACNYTGYSGRIAISELFDIDENVSEMIATGDSIQRIRDYVKKQGMIFLEQDAIQKVNDGITSFSEVKREVIV